MSTGVQYIVVYILDINLRSGVLFPKKSKGKKTIVKIQKQGGERPIRKKNPESGHFT